MLFKDTIVMGSNGTDSLTVTDTLTDTLGYKSDQYALSSQGIDTITLDDLNIASSTITLPSTYYTTTNTGTGIGIGGSGVVYGSGTGNGYTWTQPYTPAVNITNNGVEVKEGCDIKIGNHSMKEFMTKMEERLSILVPNPGLEDRWEKLKELRTQYLELEKDLLEKEKIMKILKES